MLKSGFFRVEKWHYSCRKVAFFGRISPRAHARTEKFKINVTNVTLQHSLIIMELRVTLK